MKFLRAIYDRNLYQESLGEKFSKPFFYWISISLISLFIISLSIGLSIYKNLPTFDDIKTSIPYFEINDGILSIEERFESETQELPIIIDDEFVFNAEEFKYTPQYLVATKEIIYLKGEDTGLQQISYSDVDWLRNTNKDVLINNTMKLISPEIILAVVVFTIFLIIFFAIIALTIKFLPLIVYSLVGLITAKIFNKPLTFTDSLKLFFYGSTLPLLINTIYWLIFKQNINWFISFVFTSLYIGYFISQLNKWNNGFENPVESPQTQQNLPTQEIENIKISQVNTNTNGIKVLQNENIQTNNNPGNRNV